MRTPQKQARRMNPIASRAARAVKNAAAIAFATSMLLLSAAPAMAKVTCYQNSVLPYGQPLGLNMATLDGPPFKLEALRGKPVIINVFATWCTACQEDFPGFLSVANTYSDRVHFITLDSKDSDNDVRAFRKKFGISLPIAMDRSGGFTPAIGRDSNGDIYLPGTLFLNADGTLECFRYGSLTKSQWTEHVEQLLKDNLPPASPTPAP